jgi:hypothetical protein
VKPAVIVTGSAILAGIGMLVSLGIAKPIRLFMEHFVEGLFDGVAYHRIQV